MNLVSRSDFSPASMSAAWLLFRLWVLPKAPNDSPILPNTLTALVPYLLPHEVSWTLQKANMLRMLYRMSK